MGKKGADVFRGGAGDDEIVSSAGFADIDGGSGFDTMKLVSSRRMLDLTLLANSRISGIEQIDLTANGRDTLKLAALDLFDLSDTSNTLQVIGDRNDSIELAGDWGNGGIAGRVPALYVRNGNDPDRY